MKQRKYNLGFISDHQIYEHIKKTVLLYKTIIDLDEFNKNLIDPIKLTFMQKFTARPLKKL